MSNSWEKLGLLYAPGNKKRHCKLISHAANPLPIFLSDDKYRVFYSGRDAQNRSSVGAVDIDIGAGLVVCEYDQPVYEHGERGSFFADGISIGNVFETVAGRFILFMGWQAPSDGHWRGDVGKFQLNDDLSFSLNSVKPFMASDSEDPVSLSYPWVTKYSESSYRMWYGSTIKWDAGNGEMLHVIKQACSQDGLSWKKEGLAVNYQLGRAQAFSRPTVRIDRDGTHHMWYSYRSGTGTTYRIGYACSSDGRRWTRDNDNAGITVSESGWDSDMIAYPYVFNHGGETFMLYNGNDYGRSGFGLARLRNP